MRRHPNPVSTTPSPGDENWKTPSPHVSHRHSNPSSRASTPSSSNESSRGRRDSQHRDFPRARDQSSALKHNSMSEKTVGRDARNDWVDASRHNERIRDDKHLGRPPLAPSRRGSSQVPGTHRLNIARALERQEEEKADAERQRRKKLAQSRPWRANGEPPRPKPKTKVDSSLSLSQLTSKTLLTVEIGLSVLLVQFRFDP